MSSKGPGLSTVTRIVILAAIYFLSGWLGKEATFITLQKGYQLTGNLDEFHLIWPPAGVALAAILLYGYRYWPGVFLGAVLFSFATGLKNREFTVAIVVGNTIGAITCALLAGTAGAVPKNVQPGA